LSCSFPIENGLKQGDALSQLLFNFALEYAIRKVQETNLGLDMNGTHQAYADDVNLTPQARYPFTTTCHVTFKSLPVRHLIPGLRG